MFVKNWTPTPNQYNVSEGSQITEHSFCNSKVSRVCEASSPRHYSAKSPHNTHNIGVANCIRSGNIGQHTYVLCIHILLIYRIEFMIIKFNPLKLINRNTSLAAPGALAHRLQRRTACKIQNGRQGAPKWPTGSGKGSNPRLLAILSNFR